MYLRNNLFSNNTYNGVGPDWLMTAMPIFKYQNCIYINDKLVRFGLHQNSITIDAQEEFSSDKAKNFRAAYSGARLYLIMSVITKNLKIEKIYFFVEETFRKTKFIIKKIINFIR